MRRTIYYQVTSNDDGTEWTARVSVTSYGAFPYGSRPLPFAAGTREKADSELRRYVRSIVRDTCRFEEVL